MVGLIIGAAVLFGVVLNPYFWQGLRNSRFLDEEQGEQLYDKEW